MHGKIFLQNKMCSNKCTKTIFSIQNNMCSKKYVDKIFCMSILCTKQHVFEWMHKKVFVHFLEHMLFCIVKKWFRAFLRTHVVLYSESIKRFFVHFFEHTVLCSESKQQCFRAFHRTHVVLYSESKKFFVHLFEHMLFCIVNRLKKKIPCISPNTCCFV